MCTQAVQYCDEIVSSVHKQYNITGAVVLSAHKWSNIAARWHYLCTSSAAVDQSALFFKDLEIDFAKKKCTFDVKIMEKSD